MCKTHGFRRKNTWSTHLSWTSMLFYRKVWPHWQADHCPKDFEMCFSPENAFGFTEMEVFYECHPPTIHDQICLKYESYSLSNMFEIWRHVIWITSKIFSDSYESLKHICSRFFLHVKKHPMSKSRHANLARSFNGRRWGLEIWTPTGWSSCPVGRWKRPTRHRSVAPKWHRVCWRMRLVKDAPCGTNDEDMVV